MRNKLFLLSSSTSGVPVLLELMENLQAQGIVTQNIDIFTGRERHSNGIVKDLYSNTILRLLYHIPKIRTFVRRLCSRIFINKNIKPNDIIVIHFLDPGYLRFINQLKNRTDNIIIHWWGSDLYRSNDKEKERLLKILRKSKKHILVRGMNNYFKIHFPSESNKIVFSIFGIKLLDTMNSLKTNFDLEKQKAKFSLPLDKIIISCSYNGSPGQQHLEIIDALSLLSPELKSEIFLVFPMTYGCDEIYINEVDKKLSNSRIKYLIVTKYLTSQDLAVLRLITDITINIQITDGFSASIRESLYAGNILIIGEWLPYDEIKEWGVFFIETSIPNLKDTIENTLVNYNQIKRYTINNNKIIYQKCSWSSVISDFIETYECKNLGSN